MAYVFFAIKLFFSVVGIQYNYTTLKFFNKFRINSIFSQIKIKKASSKLDFGLTRRSTLGSVVPSVLRSKLN